MRKFNVGKRVNIISGEHAGKSGIVTGRTVGQIYTAHTVVLDGEHDGRTYLGEDLEYEDLMDCEIDEPFLEMAKVVTGVVPINPFIERWKKITNGKNTSVLEKYLLENYETNNPVIKEDRFKKYKELSQCRKLRWNSKSNKASQTGDIRVINAYIPSREKIYLVLCYPKSAQEDLTSSQVKNICKVIKYLNENPEVEDEQI